MEPKCVRQKAHVLQKESEQWEQKQPCPEHNNSKNEIARTTKGTGKHHLKRLFWPSRS
jgi:hypothetical protein